MSKHTLKFLADESCDFTVVRALRSAGHDVSAISESFPSSSDLQVLRFAVYTPNRRSEDKDFGEWIFAHKETMTGVLPIRYPTKMRSKLGEAINILVDKHSFDLMKSFTVLEPGRARIRKQK